MDQFLERRWVRLVTPSLSDLFLIAILMWVFAAGQFGWKGLLADGDVGWHIRTGEYILDHHSVPRHDLYSFSKPGAPWYAWEWLTDVTDAVLYRWAGLKGIVLTAGLLIALFCTTLIRRMVWRDTHLLIAMLVALMGAGVSSIHFLARPHIFTLVLVSVSVWMIEADLRRPSRLIWLLVPITVVWTNLHGGFLALILVLAITAAGSAVEAFLRRGGWAKPLRYAAVTAACSAASLLNPYGYQLHLHVRDYLRSDWIRNVVQEFQSPSFRGESMFQFEVLLFVGLIVAGSLLRRKQIVEALWILCFAHLALSSVRHAPVFIAVCSPLIASNVSDWYCAWTARASKASLPGIFNQMAADAMKGFRRTSLWPAAVIVTLALMNHPLKWPTDFPDEMFPIKIVHDHAAQILNPNARVLTTDQWADYLIYTNPQQKVFMDGRSDFYGPEVGNEYIHLVNGQWDWETILKKYGFTLALLPVDVPLSQLLKLRPEWQVVADDGKRILLARTVAAVPSTGNSGPEPRF
jgi:hypothetical protein